MRFLESVSMGVIDFYFQTKPFGPRIL